MNGESQRSVICSSRFHRRTVNRHRYILARSERSLLSGDVDTQLVDVGGLDPNRIVENRRVHRGSFPMPRQPVDGDPMHPVVFQRVRREMHMRGKPGSGVL